MDLKKIFFLDNSVLNYAWGVPGGISDLLGWPKESALKPEAELWMGAHPKCPSRVEVEGCLTSLETLIQSYPTEFLGPKRSTGIPFLFKILAVAKPLSLQVHPDLNQAKLGFQRENKRGISLVDPDRNYKDPNSKPEILCAITPFEMLCGFRPAEEILSLIQMLRVPTLHQMASQLKSHRDSSGLEYFFSGLMTLQPEARARLLAETLAAVKKHPSKKNFDWVVKLSKIFPGDSGILAPLFLQYLKLKPGQAVFLPARELHSYLSGYGVELMGNSDNVLRGGLTQKHTDIQGLLTILSFRKSQLETLPPQKISAAEWVYPLPRQTPFRLSKILLSGRKNHEEKGARGIQIMFCLNGAGQIRWKSGSEVFSRGQSWVIPACLEPFEISGSAEIYKASAAMG